MQKSSALKSLQKRAVPEASERPEGPGSRSQVPRPRSIAAAVVVVAALGLFGTACSDSKDGSGDKDSASNAQDGGRTDEDQAVAWRKCLRENGMEIDEPKPGSEGEPGIKVDAANKDVTTKAFEACKDKAPKNGPGSEMTQEKKDALVKYAKCMREQGIDMPIPKDGQAMALPAPTTDAQKKAYEKASKACEDVRL
ncbi:hypothetical protein ABT121_34800 [Streptomyces sp. NPDC001928]|uniref:hypothetical protein n=1 Tax=Streptomyces sp. NPDC001928 TaxID=3154404 RepID=UPI003324D7B7